MATGTLIDTMSDKVGQCHRSLLAQNTTLIVFVSPTAICKPIAIHDPTLVLAVHYIIALCDVSVWHDA